MIELLDILFLQPLMVLYRIVFDFPGWLGAGGRIIVFSIVLNLVLAPIYREMEQRGRQDREKRERVARDVARMKAHFSGRERYFYIRAVHRQYRYHPIQALFSSADLLVQVFAFATVYRFLSGLDELHGASFGHIGDLSQPDGLLAGLNLLPLLMTAINMASVYYYVNDRGRRVQAVGLSLVFLVLLYASPAGLVLYWTMNNFWSLVRNMRAKPLQAGAVAR